MFPKLGGSIIASSFLTSIAIKKSLTRAEIIFPSYKKISCLLIRKKDFFTPIIFEGIPLELSTLFKREAEQT